MFRIKICGITNIQDATAVAAAGGDAVGLNFYGASPRSVTADQAEQICDSLSGEVATVGVFVDSPTALVRDTFERLRLDWIQLHGHESPEYLLELEDRPVIKAFRVGKEGLTPVVRYLDQCHRIRTQPKAVLIDAHVPDEYGGTGQVADWHKLQNWRNAVGELPLILAGGLRASNVAAAIRAVEPTAVDTASGVESTPGRKDRGQVQEFVAAANRGFQEIDSYR